MSKRVKLVLQPSYLSIRSHRHYAYSSPCAILLKHSFGLKSQKIPGQHIFITHAINGDLEATLINSISNKYHRTLEGLRRTHQ